MTHRKKLSRFSPDEIHVLAGGVPFWLDQSERECPGCGVTAVRTYMHYCRPDKSAVISYTWCANCRRVSESTGPGPGVAFTDPLENLFRADRPAMNSQYDFFDKLWSEGTLPQTFDPPPSRGRRPSRTRRQAPHRRRAR